MLLVKALDGVGGSEGGYVDYLVLPCFSGRWEVEVALGWLGKSACTRFYLRASLVQCTADGSSELCVCECVSKP